MNILRQLTAYWRTSIRWQRVTLWLGYLVTAASVIYLLRALQLHASDLPEHWTERYSSVWFAVSVLMFVASVACGFLIWRRLLSCEHLDIDVMPSASIYLVSQIGKYIPGNVAQHVGRVFLARRHGIAVATTTKFIIIEMIVVVVAAVSVVAAICFFQPRLGAQIFAIIENTHSPTGILIFAILTLGLVSAVVASLSKEAVRASGGPTVASLNITQVLSLVGLGLLAFIVLGASFQVLLAKCLMVADPGFGACLIWITSSWLIGFFTPGAPAGLGVREFVLVTLVAAEYGQPVALESALAFRGVSVIGDLVVLGIGLMAGRMSRPASGSVASRT